MSGGAATGAQVVLVRHAETEWSRAGRHTGRTDVPLTEEGRRAARALAPELAGRHFALVLASPLRRARETCELSGLGALARVAPELLEWDYGDYEGLTTPQIRERRPDWSLWRDGCPGGESPTQVGERADRALGQIGEAAGDVAVFSHGHLLRVLAARWIGHEPALGCRLGLSPGALCLLAHENGNAVIAGWNRAPER
jgi:probable phosphoglycerate mutase